MSLINDMLRDLEKRRQKEAPANETDHAPRAVIGHSSLRVWLWRGSGLVLALGVVLWLGGSLWPGKKIPGTAGDEMKDAPIVKMGVDEKWVQKADESKIKPIETAPGQNSVAQAPAKQTDSSAARAVAGRLLDLQVEELDSSARIRLSFADLPEYHLLQSGAGNAPLIISFRHTRIDENLDIPEMVGPLLTRISLRPQKEQLQLLADLGERTEVRGLEWVKQARSGHELIIEVAAAEVQNPPEQVAQPAEQAKPEPLITEATATAPLRTQPTPAAEPPRVSKSSNRPAPEKQAYQAGLKAMQQRHWAAAADHFKRALRHQPEMLTARLQLIASLQQQGQSEQAVKQIRQGLEQRPADPVLRKQYARYLLDRKAFAPAIELLQSAPLPAVSRDTEYHALLAALLQQAGRFAAAGQVYRQLLQVRADNALWWFGLALALDQAQEHEEASQAYKQALALPQLQDNLRAYSSERLRVL